MSIGAGGFLSIIAAAIAVWMAKSIKNAAPFSFRIVDKDAAAEIANLRVELAASVAREAALKGELAVMKYRLRERGGRHPEGE